MFAEARCRSIRFEVSYNSYRQSFLPLWLIKGPTSEIVKKVKRKKRQQPGEYTPSPYISMVATNHYYP
jgi:hypothetical protein